MFIRSTVFLFGLGVFLGSVTSLDLNQFDSCQKCLAFAKNACSQDKDCVLAMIKEKECRICDCEIVSSMFEKKVPAVVTQGCSAHVKDPRSAIAFYDATVGQCPPCKMLIEEFTKCFVANDGVYSLFTGLECVSESKALSQTNIWSCGQCLTEKLFPKYY